ncbi:hypothetical protein P7K49_034404, partial [Saguinus oedipus]
MNIVLQALAQPFAQWKVLPHWSGASFGLLWSLMVLNSAWPGSICLCLSHLDPNPSALCPLPAPSQSQADPSACAQPNLSAPASPSHYDPPAHASPILAPPDAPPHHSAGPLPPSP